MLSDEAMRAAEIVHYALADQRCAGVWVSDRGKAGSFPHNVALDGDFDLVGLAEHMHLPALLAVAEAAREIAVLGICDCTRDMKLGENCRHCRLRAALEQLPKGGKGGR